MKKLITLKLKQQPVIPVEAEAITPGNLSGKNRDEILRLPVWSGNRQEELGDYFEVEIPETPGPSAGSLPESSLPKVVLHGDLSKFKNIGQGMAGGEMEVCGSTGFHTGARMKGGILRIKGSAGDWLGAHMEGGLLSVEGNAGHFAGAAYRGLTQGMTGGMILIRGNAGQMLGARMRRGLIALGGDCGDHLGFKMLAGTILVAGTPGVRVGINMTRGTIILLRQAELFPSFYENCTYHPVIWQLIYRELQQKGFKLAEAYKHTLFKRYSGDAIKGAKGEVWICQMS